MEKYKHQIKEFTELHQKGLTLSQISQITGKTNKQIGHSLRKKGIKPNKYIKLGDTSELDQLLLGSMLGDGHIAKIKGPSATYFRIGHGSKQVCYLEYKKLILDRYNLSKRDIYKYRHISDRYINGFCDSFFLDSKVHSIFSNYRAIFYPNGKKVVPMNYIEKLEPLGLAIWFMDDGQLATRSYQINSTGFTKEECLDLIVFLKKKFDLDCTLQKNNIIYIRTSSIRKFNNLILPFVPECMKYKIKRSM